MKRHAAREPMYTYATHRELAGPCEATGCDDKQVAAFSLWTKEVGQVDVGLCARHAQQLCTGLYHAVNE